MMQDKDKDKKKEEKTKKEYGDTSRKILEIINKKEQEKGDEGCQWGRRF